MKEREGERERKIERLSFEIGRLLLEIRVVWLLVPGQA